MRVGSFRQEGRNHITATQTTFAPLSRHIFALIDRGPPVGAPGGPTHTSPQKDPPLAKPPSPRTMNERWLHKLQAAQTVRRESARGRKSLRTDENQSATNPLVRGHFWASSLVGGLGQASLIRMRPLVQVQVGPRLIRFANQIGVASQLPLDSSRRQRPVRSSSGPAGTRH